jgi:hypothetical protein
LAEDERFALTTASPMPALITASPMAPGSATDSRPDVTYLDEIADRASWRRTLGADGTDRDEPAVRALSQAP